MGLKFVGITEARGHLIGCIKCHTYITCQAEVTSTAFTGSTGPATLYKRAWNVSHGELGKRELTTGFHVVRDVNCISCNKKLGWMYELALVPSQVYKEGQVILENALVTIIQGPMADPLGEDEKYSGPMPTPIETPRHHRPSTSSSYSSGSYTESSSSSASFSSADLDERPRH